MNRLDLSHSPTFLSHFNRSLEDLSGNGLDLTGTTVNYTEFEPQHFGLAPGSDVRRPAYDAALDIAGPMTIEVTGYFYSTPSGAIFASFTATGETDPTNTQWQLSAHTATQLRWIHEHGATGLDDIHLSTNATESLPRPHSRFHVAAVRDSSGVVRLYLNGRQHGDPSPAFPAPTSGTSAFMRVMFGSTAFGLDGLKVTPSALTGADVAASAEYVLGVAPVTAGTLWVGATTDTTATVVARMSGPVAALTLDVSGGVGPLTQATDADDVARFDLTGLTPGTEYTCTLTCGVTGRFRTHAAAAGSPASFKLAFGGDCDIGSTHPVFNAIPAQDPDMFLILGDLHYSNIATNSPALFHAALDAVQASPAQHRLYRSVATAYVWDDHDYGANDSNGSSASKLAAATVYRSRVPHYTLPHATAIYQTWDIGRVRFILTDQRSEATADSATDNSSKSMLGATQKAWFKDLITNSPGMLMVWICPRWFANANHTDSWNNFSTERRELVDHIKANAHGRVVVLEADQHTGAIDDGSHVDHATGGGEPLPCFRAAPLDTFTSVLGGTYSHGEFAARGQFGTMSVADDGTDIDVTWTLLNSTGAVLTTYTFTVTP